MNNVCNYIRDYLFYFSTVVKEDIQLSRQYWFRKVTPIGTKVSVMCTKLVLCEQACKYGLKSYIRSSYPQLLPGKIDGDKKDYVEAYNSGESTACYHQSNENYTESYCD